MALTKIVLAVLLLMPSLALADLAAPETQEWQLISAAAEGPLAKRMSRLGALFREIQAASRDGRDLAPASPLADEMKTLFLEAKQFPPSPMPVGSHCGAQATEQDFRARLDALAELAGALSTALADRQANETARLLGEMRALRSQGHCIYNP